MAQREERLAPATRNYVIFGLAFIIAVGLAIRDWTDPRERRGESDSPLRLLLISDRAEGPAAVLVDVDGFSVASISPSEAIAEGHELLDEPGAADYRAAVTYADELGFGFVALDLLDADERTPINWGLSEGAPGIDALPPASARFAVFSVGDVAVEAPRMRSVGMPDGPIFDPRLVALDSLRLALYDHPDLTRLWTDELSATEAQAQHVLDSRQLDERRTMLLGDHARWRELDEIWPDPERVPGSVAGEWERVQAAPIPGGLLLEVRPVRLRVDVNRRSRLELAEQATLEFLPSAALRDPQPDDGAARRACAGLPERLGDQASIAVAPDGAAVVIHEGPGEPTELFVFEQRADQPECRARSIGVFELGERAVGRPSATGAMAWNYDDDWLHWWDALGEHQLRVPGIDLYSGPWWTDGDLLAMIGERTRPAVDVEVVDELAEGFPVFGYESVLILLATKPDQDPRATIEIGLGELFSGGGEAVPASTLPALLDLRPAGPTELLFTTERCLDQPRDDQPCLHRLRAAAPLGATVRELAAGSRTLADTITVETLGPLPAHVELAVAADGSRVAWIDLHTRALMIADLRGPNRMVARRLDSDPDPEMSLRISADGRLVLAEIAVELELGRRQPESVPMPRVFLLDPPGR